MKLKKMIQVSAAALFGAACLFIGTGIESQAAENATTMAATDYLNVRTGASTNNRIIGVLSPGESVVVTGVTNGWYHVEYKGQSGYAYQKYMNFEGSSADGDVENGKETDMVSIVYLNVRQQPSTNSSILGVLAPGEKIQVTGKSNSWYKVKYNGQNAYTYADYLTFINADSEAAGTPGFEKRKMTTAVGCNFRSGPSESYRIIDGFQKGTVLTAVGQQNGWIQIDHNGTIGYIYGGNLVDGELSYAAEGETLTTTADVNLRTSGSLNARVILTIPKGSKVEVISREGDWYIVDYKGDSGAVYSKYVK